MSGISALVRGKPRPSGRGGRQWRGFDMGTWCRFPARHSRYRVLAGSASATASSQREGLHSV
ncbi:MAG: hypothetical protein OXC07_02315 [Kistimonas sp.]|nr:hypothetical protein [Kistimonas sp.]